MKRFGSVKAEWGLTQRLVVIADRYLGLAKMRVTSVPWLLSTLWHVRESPFHLSVPEERSFKVKNGQMLSYEIHHAEVYLPGQSSVYICHRTPIACQLVAQCTSKQRSLFS